MDNLKWYDAALIVIILLSLLIIISIFLKKINENSKIKKEKKLELKHHKKEEKNKRNEELKQLKQNLFQKKQKNKITSILFTEEIFSYLNESILRFKEGKTIISINYISDKNTEKKYIEYYVQYMNKSLIIPISAHDEDEYSLDWEIDLNDYASLNFRKISIIIFENVNLKKENNSNNIGFYESQISNKIIVTNKENILRIIENLIKHFIKEVNKLFSTATSEKSLSLKQQETKNYELKKTDIVISFKNNVLKAIDEFENGIFVFKKELKKTKVEYKKLTGLDLSDIIDVFENRINEIEMLVNSMEEIINQKK